MAKKKGSSKSNKSHSFDDLVEIASSGKKIGEVDCKVTLNVGGRKLNAYTAHLAKYEILFYCDGGTASYVIDMYGDRARAELHDWEFDEE